MFRRSKILAEKPNLQMFPRFVARKKHLYLQGLFTILRDIIHLDVGNRIG